MAEATGDVLDRPPTNGDGHNHSGKTKEVFGWLKGKSLDALQSVESAFGTVTGKAALEKVASYIQESEAVNAAMATRIYDLLDRDARLRKRVKTAENTANWLIVVSVIYAAAIGLLLYLVLSRS
jgi:hypothetical protein